MTPEYFIIPIIMGQATSIIQALKTGIILLDISLLIFLMCIFYTMDVDYVKDFYKRWGEQHKKSIVISSEINKRSIRFRAIMHYLAQPNGSIYRLKEDMEYDWEAEEEKRSEYLVDQTKHFKLTKDISGSIRNITKEKTRFAQHTDMVEYNTLVLYSYTCPLATIQQWIDDCVKDYKEFLRHSSNEKQLYITASTTKTTSEANKKKTGKAITIDSVPWESSITFTNSYFQNMETILQKIDFFLQNKQWYLERGIPYNLGILLYGEPGCGKTRFIKQLMNYTGRHGIDIKLNDGMDFNDLQHIIYKEELDETHIIPQDQRILIFEDIDALGEVVKDRDTKAQKASSNAAMAAAVATSAPTQVHTLAGQAPKDHSTNCDEMKIFSNLFKLTSDMQNNNLSYLLNMLDGIHECSGRIIIMTTNKVDVLDKALIRPGRIDIKLHFQKCSTYDIAKMIEKFWNISMAAVTILPELDQKYTSADIINMFRSTDDFETIRADFCVA
jgi:ATP-dependent 26S proteasome regulatory subunit